jgi:hypothetical protein
MQLDGHFGERQLPVTVISKKQCLEVEMAHEERLAAGETAEADDLIPAVDASFPRVCGEGWLSDRLWTFV